MKAKYRTLREFSENSSRLYGEQPALVERGGTTYTYAMLHDEITALQERLAASGVEQGDRVALLGENGPRWGITYLAITGMAAVVVPILPDFSATEISSILDHAEVTAVCTSRRHYSQVADYTAAEFVLLMEDNRIVDPGTSREAVATYEVLTSPPAAPHTGDASTRATPDEHDLAAILYTSGTTGKPKGVMLTHRNLVQNVIGSLALVDIGTDDRFLSILPLAHTYECTIGFLVPLAAGATVHYLSGPPVLSSLMPAMEEVQPTMMLTVPLIMEKVYQAKVKPLFRKPLLRLVGRVRPLRVALHRIAGRKIHAAFGGALRFFGIGGAPLSAETERFLREAKFPYSIGYGLTETSPLIAGTNARDTRYRSTGPAIQNVEVRLDRSSGYGGLGEIQVRGPSVTSGYYKNEEATKAAFTDDGWFRTGDLGEVDTDGYLYVKGRLKNVIVGPSGENIYPEDIEDAINAHELVRESVVFQWQGELVARVHLDFEELEKGLDAHDDSDTLQARAEELLAAIRAAVNQQISRFARLGKVFLEREPFERTPTRKIRRFLYTTLNPGASDPAPSDGVDGVNPDR